jgi:hypothetical protein
MMQKTFRSAGCPPIRQRKKQLSNDTMVNSLSKNEMPRRAAAIQARGSTNDLVAISLPRPLVNFAST